MDLEVFSDVACPWCYVGKRRLEAALTRFEHRDQVSVKWRSFELDPQAPAEREGELASHLAAKYGIGVDDARQRQQELAELAAGEGIDMRFERVRSGSTFDAHRLLHLAAHHGLQAEAKERLLRAYFTEGELLSDHETLARLASEIGIDAKEASEALSSGRYADEVRDDEQAASALGISSVPTFVVDRAIGVSGAQPPEVLLELLQESWARRASSATTAA